jgi:hypothetical protein
MELRRSGGPERGSSGAGVAEQLEQPWVPE